MIVVDNSVLVPAVAATRRSAQARGVASKDSQWILPPLWKFEFTNAVATLSRSGAMDPRAARTALAEAQTLVAGREVAVDQVHALQLAVALSVSGYDAQYLALAEAFGIKCVTEDTQMARRSRGLAILLDDFMS